MTRRKLLKRGETVSIELIGRTKKRETFDGNVLAADDLAIKVRVSHYEVRYERSPDPRFALVQRREFTHETEHLIPWPRIHTIEVLAPVAAGGGQTP